MNNQEAKLILQAYRPGGGDASDPLFAEALEQVRHDPEMQKWFADAQALDARIQSKLKPGVVVPPDLKASLLALRKIIRPAPWWRQPRKLAAIAATLLLLTGTTFVLLPGRPQPLGLFCEKMVRYSRQEHGHTSFESPDITKIQKWLHDRNIDANFELPVGLQGRPAEGCRVIDWDGHKGVMICFVLEGGEHLDFFVMDRTGLPGLPENSPPQFVSAGGLMTATWTVSGKVYCLTGEGDKKSLEKRIVNKNYG